MCYAICIPCAWPARKRPFAICSLFICSQGIPCPAVARRTFQWLDAEKDEAVLAAAYTQVSNHAGRLLCLLEDSGRDAWLEYVYERWAEVEDALFLRMPDPAIDRIGNISFRRIAPPNAKIFRRAPALFASGRGVCLSTYSRVKTTAARNTPCAARDGAFWLRP